MKELTLYQLSSLLEEYAGGYEEIEDNEIDFMHHLNDLGLIDTYYIERNNDHSHWIEVSIICELRNGNEWTKWITSVYEHEVSFKDTTMGELLEFINNYERKSAEIKYLIEYNNK